MKEITAIIRMNKIQPTKAALGAAGYPSLTVCKVLGRGKQKGLQYEFSPALLPLEVPDQTEPVRFIPKRMLILVVEDKCCQKVIDLIISANQTGNIGDGKIFVSPIAQTLRIRTGETGDSALL